MANRAIDTKDEKSISKRLNELKHNLSDLIKEVRAVTFNLTPHERFDYGIVATLSKMADQLTKLLVERFILKIKPILTAGLIH
jgi:signal transduction histidine kinase